MGFRRHIERNYSDRATISRMTDFETEEGETRQTLGDIYTDVPCRISQRALSTNNQRESFNEIAYEIKLLISPEIAISQGDTITVVRKNSSKIYKAGEPFLYPTHQEVILNRRGKA